MMRLTPKQRQAVAEYAAACKQYMENTDERPWVTAMARKAKLVPKPATDEQKAARLVDFIAVEVTTCTHRDCDGVAVWSSMPGLTLCAEHLDEFRDVVAARIKECINDALDRPPTVPYTDDGREAIAKAIGAELVKIEREPGSK